MNKLTFRRGVANDMPAVLKLEAAQDHPWTEEDFDDAIAENRASIDLAELGGHLVGFYVWQNTSLSTFVLNMAVHERCRRHGIGRAIIDRLKGKLMRDRIIFEVNERNVGAQKFLKAMGFLATKVHRNYYDEWATPEDCFVFEWYPPVIKKSA